MSPRVKEVYPDNDFRLILIFDWENGLDLYSDTIYLDSECLSDELAVSLSMTPP